MSCCSLRTPTVAVALLGALCSPTMAWAAGPPRPAQATVCENRCGGPAAAPQVGTTRFRKPAAILLGLGSGLGIGRLVRDRTRAPATPLTQLRWADAALAGGALAFYQGPTLLFPHDAPDLLAGRWTDCAKDPSPPADRLNGFDRSLRRLLAGGPAADAARLRRRQFFDHLSWTTLFATLALPAGAAHRFPGRDLLVTIESAGAAGAVSAAVKHVFHRPRPFVHSCDPGDTGRLCDHDAQLSFFSGHTAMAFAGAVAAGRLAGFRGTPDRGRIWATGLALATSTGLLRIAADKHHGTDVVAGLVVGGVAGWVVPLLHRPAETEDPLSGIAPVPPPSPVPLMIVPLAVGGLDARLDAGMAAGGPAMGIRIAW